MEKKKDETGRICPKCLSNRVHRSRSRGLEVVVRLVGLGFYRCHHCQYRYIRYRGFTIRQKKLFVYVFLAVLLCLLVWYGLDYFKASRPDLPGE
jgi:hypothetical protein